MRLRTLANSRRVRSTWGSIEVPPLSINSTTSMRSSRPRRQLSPADRLFQPLPELRRIEQLRVPRGHSRQVDAIEMEGEGPLIGVHMLDPAHEAEAGEDEQRVEVRRQAPLHAAIEIDR